MPYGGKMLFAALCVSLLSLAIILAGCVYLDRSLRASERRWLSAVADIRHKQDDLTELLALERVWAERITAAVDDDDPGAEYIASAAQCAIMRSMNGMVRDGRESNQSRLLGGRESWQPSERKASPETPPRR